MNLRHLGLFSLLFVLLMAGSASVATAQTPASVSSAPVCFVFIKDIHYGQQDSGSAADVGTLQSFLVREGYFDAAKLGTGHFGPITLSSVKKFQAAQGVPATGYVGPLTRAAIAKVEGCGNQPAATLYSISPASGSVGAEVSIRGFGFSSSNTVLIDGMVAQRDVPITSSVAIACTTDPSCHGGINQTITFTVPGSLSPYCPPGSMCALYMRVLEPGDVTVTVRNDSGVSNGLPFTVTK